MPIKIGGGIITPGGGGGGGGTYLPDSIVEYGNFAAGDFSEFWDSGAHGRTGVDHGARIVASDINGGYKCKIKTEVGVTPYYYGDTGNIRVHLLGGADVEALLVQGQTFYRCLSIRWSTESPPDIYAGDEIHSSGSYPLASGSVPLNGFGISSDNGTPRKIWRIRGSNDLDANPSFNQWTFGDSPQSDDNGGNRQSQSWSGLSEVVTQNEWIHTFYKMVFHPTNGTFILSCAAHGDGAVEVINKTGIGTAYGNNPSEISHYPMMSMYYNSSITGIQIIEYLGGAYGSDEYSLKYWQNQRLGYAFHDLG